MESILLVLQYNNIVILIIFNKDITLIIRNNKVLIINFLSLSLYYPEFIALQLATCTVMVSYR